MWIDIVITTLSATVGFLNMPAKHQTNVYLVWSIPMLASYSITKNLPLSVAASSLIVYAWSTHYVIAATDDTEDDSSDDGSTGVDSASADVDDDAALLDSDCSCKRFHSL